MRRIIFGAIWLTGFLAVLLSWGMMWGRAEGEGPRRVIVANGYFGTERKPCPIEAIIPEIGRRQIIGQVTGGCNISSIGWVNEWFYYQYVYEKGKQRYGTRLERANQRFDQQEVIIEGFWGTPGAMFIGPDGHYLIEAKRDIGTLGEILITNLTDGSKRPSLFPYEDTFTNRVFSPDGQWLVVSVWHQTTGLRAATAYLVNLATGAVQAVPLPTTDSSNTEGIVWTKSPEWLVLTHTYYIDNGVAVDDIYKKHPTENGVTLLASGQDGTTYSGWVHESGIIGLLKDQTFRAVSIDTGQTLWQLQGVDKVITSSDPAVWRELPPDWIYFRMTDGRLGRCRVDGSDLGVYDIRNLDVLNIWGWSADGEWVWLRKVANNPDFEDVVRVQRDTGKIEVIFGNTHLAFAGQSPDSRWIYYQDENHNLRRINLDGDPQSEIIVPFDNGLAYPLAWTPPYQAEWQPTRTLTIGIGLMSFSTLTPIVLWRRRRKPRRT